MKEPMSVESEQLMLFAMINSDDSLIYIGWLNLGSTGLSDEETSEV